MTTTPLILALDDQALEHLAVALRVHVANLRKRGLTAPAALRQLEHLTAELVTSGPDVSPPVTVREQDHAAEQSAWVDPKAAAHLTGLSESSLRRAMRAGSLASVKVGRCRRISRDALEAFMNTTEQE